MDRLMEIFKELVSIESHKFISGLDRRDKFVHKVMLKSILKDGDVK